MQQRHLLVSSDKRMLKGERRSDGGKNAMRLVRATGAGEGLGVHGTLALYELTRYLQPHTLPIHVYIRKSSSGAHQRTSLYPYRFQTIAEMLVGCNGEY